MSNSNNAPFHVPPEWNSLSLTELNRLNIELQKERSNYASKFQHYYNRTREAESHMAERDLLSHHLKELMVTKSPQTFADLPIALSLIEEFIEHIPAVKNIRPLLTGVRQVIKTSLVDTSV